MFRNIPDAQAQSAQAPGDPAFIQIVGRHFQFHTIPYRDAYPAFSHLSANRGQHQVLVLQLHAKHCSRKHRCNDTFHFNMLFFHFVSVENRSQVKREDPQTDNTGVAKERALR